LQNFAYFVYVKNVFNVKHNLQERDRNGNGTGRNRMGAEGMPVVAGQEWERRHGSRIVKAVPCKTVINHHTACSNTSACCIHTHTHTDAAAPTIIDLNEVIL